MQHARLPVSTLQLSGNKALPEQLNNIYLIHGEPSVLIDAGYQNAANLEAIQRAFDVRTFDRLFLTHCHRDHAEAAVAYQHRFGLTLHHHPSEYLINYKQGVKERIDDELRDGQRFDLGGDSLVVVHTPGHTRGHCCFYLEGSQQLFTGDLVLGEGTTWVGPPDGDMTAYLSSLERILELPLTQLLPGHGPAVERPHERIREIRDHRLMREGEILRFLGQGCTTTSELVAAIYVDLPASRVPMALLTVEGHLKKLLDERRVHRNSAKLQLA